MNMISYPSAELTHFDTWPPRALANKSLRSSKHSTNLQAVLLLDRQLILQLPNVNALNSRTHVKLQHCEDCAKH